MNIDIPYIWWWWHISSRKYCVNVYWNQSLVVCEQHQLKLNWLQCNFRPWADCFNYHRICCCDALWYVCVCVLRCACEIKMERNRAKRTRLPNQNNNNNNKQLTTKNCEIFETVRCWLKLTCEHIEINALTRLHTHTQGERWIELTREERENNHHSAKAALATNTKNQRK